MAATEPILSPADAALARARAYALLSRLVTRGAGRELLSELAKIPSLAAMLPADPDAASLAADHHELFGLQVFPYAGVYLDPRRLTGGAAADAALAAYRDGGFSPDLSSASADHLGAELGFLAHLSHATAETGAELSALERGFLDQVLTWLPPFVSAAAAHPRSLWTQLAELVMELCSAHRSELGGVPAPPSLPPAPDPLADSETGVRRLVDFLVTPVHSGVLLSRSELSRVGRRQSLPRGFGSRELTLANLLRNAGEYDCIPEVARDLRATVTAHLDRYHTFAADSQLAPFVAPWIERAAGTVRMLDEMDRTARQ